MSPAPARTAAQTLSREARDTLFLLAVIGWTLLPHADHLPLWASLMAGGMLLWRALAAVGLTRVPHRAVLMLLLATSIGITLWTQKTLFMGQDAGVAMLTLLMAMKTLELRARRDAMVVFFLGFFLVLTNFLYSQTLLVAAAMILAVWGLLTALTLAHMPAGYPGLRMTSMISGRAALWGTPIMVVLFVLFPRIGPLWAMPAPGAATTGLGGDMRFGSMGSLIQDDTVALRIKPLSGPLPPDAERYFRGPVLSAFDGLTWHASTPESTEAATADENPAPLQLLNAPFRYEITLEPLAQPTLPLLEFSRDLNFPSTLSALNPRLNDDLQWQLKRTPTERLRFEAVAYTQFRYQPQHPPPADLDLPIGYNPRTLAWARQLRATPALQDASARVLAQQVLQHIRQQPYRYSLSPGTYGAEQPRQAIDEFWLDRRVGFCEHYASAFVVVMRAMGVPARVVTGYQGTDPEPQDGYYVVRQSNAHAWAEIWQADQGWLRIDPTSAVAPDRVERNRQAAQTKGFVGQMLGNTSLNLLAHLRNNWEAINNRWNQWVLSYSRNEQINLLKNLGWSTPSLDDLAPLLAWVLGVTGLVGAAWASWERRRQDPWARRLQAVRGRLRQLGLEAPDHLGPRGLAAQTATLGARANTVTQALLALDESRYASDQAHPPSRQWWRDFKRACEAVNAST